MSEKTLVLWAALAFAGGLIWGFLLTNWLSGECPALRVHGYLLVDGTTGHESRGVRFIEVMRKKTGYTRTVRLYASPFDEGYCTKNPCKAWQDIIVVSMKSLKEYNDPELQGLLGHEFGHLLAGHQRSSHEEAKKFEERRQEEADGFAIDAVGEAAVFLYYQKRGWDSAGAWQRVVKGKAALEAFLKRNAH